MEKLEVPAEIKMDLVCSLFLLFQWGWKSVMSHKYRSGFQSTFLLVISIPGTLLWLVIFIWVYRKYHGLLEQMQDKKLAATAVTLFINMRLVLVGSILLATVVLLIQFT